MNILLFIYVKEITIYSEKENYSTCLQFAKLECMFVVFITARM